MVRADLVSRALETLNLSDSATNIFSGLVSVTDTVSLSDLATWQAAQAVMEGQEKTHQMLYLQMESELDEARQALGAVDEVKAAYEAENEALRKELITADKTRRQTEIELETERRRHGKTNKRVEDLESQLRAVVPEETMAPPQSLGGVVIPRWKLNPNLRRKPFVG